MKFCLDTIAKSLETKSFCLETITGSTFVSRQIVLSRDKFCLAFCLDFCLDCLDFCLDCLDVCLETKLVNEGVGAYFYGPQNTPLNTQKSLGILKVHPCPHIGANIMYFLVFVFYK